VTTKALHFPNRWFPCIGSFASVINSICLNRREDPTTFLWPNNTDIHFAEGFNCLNTTQFTCLWPHKLRGNMGSRSPGNWKASITKCE